MMKNHTNDTTTRPRMITLNLSDEVCDQLAAKAASHGLLIGQLLENFVNDLSYSITADISDSQMAARDWYDSSLFSLEEDDSLLRWMFIEKINVIKFLDNWYALNVGESDLAFSVLHSEDTDTEEIESLKLKLAEYQAQHDAIIARFLSLYPSADIESEIIKCRSWMEEYMQLID